MTSSEVLDKIHMLPKQVQEHLFLYVDFLFNTYSSSNAKQGKGTQSKDFFDENELTEAGREWLEHRAEKALASLDKSMSWQEAREKIHNKHNFPQ